MTTDHRTHKPHSIHAALLWLAPAAVIAALLLALLPTPAPVAAPASDAAAQPSAVPVLPTPAGTVWQPDHSAVDWSKLDAAPDPSMSVAAYGQ